MHTDSRETDPRGARLDDLDDALVAVRRGLQRPGYRRRLLAGLSAELPLATLRLLRAVQRAAAPPSIGEVADVLAIDPSTASRVVERAVDAGFLERRVCRDDRRRTRLHLSSSGAVLLDEVTDRRRELLGEATAQWPVADLDAFVRLLHELVAGFDAVEAGS